MSGTYRIASSSSSSSDQSAVLSTVNDPLVLKMHCSSDISITSEQIKDFTSALITKNPGQKYQWTFIIPFQEHETPITSQTIDAVSANATVPKVYQGPECCVTLPAHASSGAMWPLRLGPECGVVQTIFAELLLSGSSVAADDLPDLQTNINDAIGTHLCPSNQRVWVFVTSRQLVHSKCHGVN